MSIVQDYTKLLPSNLRNVLKWKQFIQAVQAIFSDLKDEKVDRLVNQWIIDEASDTDLKNLITRFGWKLLQNTGWTATSEYLRRQAQTVVERIQYKNCEKAYLAEAYSYNLYAHVYPLVDIVANNTLSPFITFNESSESEDIIYTLDDSSTDRYLDETDFFTSVITLDQQSYIDKITRNILYSYTFNFIENATEFMSTNTLKTLINDVSQIKRITEKIYYEPTLKVYFSEWAFNLIATASGIENWTSLCTPSTGLQVTATPQNDYIKQSISSGALWNNLTGSGQRDWTDIACSSTGEKITALANDGYIYISPNSGTTWSEIKKYNVGDTGPAGGFIVYNDDNNYIELHPYDLGSGVFSNLTSGVAGTSTEFLSGQANTTNIINQIIYTQKEYSLGETGPAGGLIFYKDGNNYLELAPNDSGFNDVYSNISGALVGTSEAIWSGQPNTSGIVNQSFYGILEYSVGDTGPGSGVIFYKNNQTYREITSEDISSGSFWSYRSGVLGTSPNFNSGELNTQLICGGYNIGQIGPGGGYIFYMKDDIYYEATPVISTGEAWSNISGALVGTSDLFGSGQANTTNIVNQIFSGVANYSIGDIGPANGYIFYKDGDTYYEVAPYDQASGVVWSNISGTLVGTSLDIGSGQINTYNITYQNSSYEVGDTGPAGGTIFYVNGTNYLEVSPDISSGSVWSNVSGSAANTSDDFGSGQLNTNTIINQGSHTTSSAKLTDDYVLNGYSDWYLPSKDEFDYINDLLSGSLTNSYWTSSENGDSSGCVFNSNNITINRQIPPELNSWLGLAHGNGVTVAGSNDGTNRIMRSLDDGNSWTVIDIGTDFAPHAVAFGDGVFITVNGEESASGILRSVDDGLTWTRHLTSGSIKLYGVGFGNHEFYACGDSEYVLKSTDLGLTWEALYTGQSNFIGHGAAYGNGTWCFCGDALYIPTIIRTQNNGSSFDATIVEGAGGIYSIWDGVYGIDYGNGVWISTGLSSTIHRSIDDGDSWQEISLNLPSYFSGDGVAYHDNTFVVVGYPVFISQNFAYSFDLGLTWHTKAIKNFLRDSVWGINNFVFIADYAGEELGDSYISGNWDGEKTPIFEAESKSVLNYVKAIRSFTSEASSGAATLCYNLVQGGYDDWYLPSKNELDAIYNNLVSGGLISFPNADYWSSSELDSSNAYIKNLNTGVTNTDNKASGSAVSTYTWEEITENNLITDFKYGNNLIGVGTSGGAGTIIYSSDLGDTWIDAGVSISQPLVNLAYGISGSTGIFITGAIVNIGDEGTPNYEFDTLRSVDEGVSWDLITLSISSDGFGGYGGGSSVTMAFGNNVFVSFPLPLNNTVYRSLDYGLNWVSGSLAFEGYYNYDTTYGNETFITVGYDASLQGSILKSTDNGENWTRTVITDTALLSVAYGENIFITVGSKSGTQGSILRSEDFGETWDVITNPDPSITLLYNVSYSNGVFRALQSTPPILIESADLGLTWKVVEALPESVSQVSNVFAVENNVFISTYNDLILKGAYIPQDLNYVRAIRSFSSSEIHCTSGSAYTCNNLVYGGLDDWYLPSKDELNLVYTQLFTEAIIYPDADYWTSSEIDSSSSHVINLFDGTSGTAFKNSESPYTVAIRAFPAGLYVGAALLAYNSIEGGMSDWYLPSRDELRYIHDLYLSGIITVNYLEDQYWSSSETDDDEAYLISGVLYPEYTSGELCYLPKSGSLIAVKGVREFTLKDSWHTCTAGAGKLCDEASFNGYSDWYLPSKDEMDLVYENVVQEGLGNLSLPSPYWTSSEYGSSGSTAYGIIFETDTFTPYQKNTEIRTRAVRNFLESGTVPVYCTEGGAFSCNNLTYGGYSDWYLPSLEELNTLYLNFSSGGLGNFSGTTYWSSSESGSLNAYIQDFSTGVSSENTKNSNSQIRAIRSFTKILPNQENWISVALSSNGSNIYAITTDGVIWSSFDSGDSWISQSISSGTLTDITCSSNGNHLAVSMLSGNILISSNSGSTWTPSSSGIKNWTTINSTSTGSKIFAGAINDYIYASSDYGITWVAKSDSGINNWNCISCSSDGVNIIGGTGIAPSTTGALYYSKDSGEIWEQITGSENLIWTDLVSSSSGTRIYGTTYNGSIYLLLRSSLNIKTFTDYDETLTATQETIFIDSNYATTSDVLSDLLRGSVRLGNGSHTTIDDTITDVQSYIYTINNFDPYTSELLTGKTANFRRAIYEKQATPDFTEAAFFNSSGSLVIYTKFPKIILNSGSIYSNINFYLEEE